MKLLGIVLLSIASIAVLIGLVLPVASLILGLGIEVPSFWARSGKVHLVVLYPFISLLAGLLLVVSWLGHLEAPRLIQPTDMKRRNTLSLTEVGYSMRFTNVMKRIFRAAWVFAVNACVAWLMFTRLRSVGFPEFNFQLWFEFVFEVILPIVGIVLEAVNWKFTRWVNVGCLTMAGSFWLAAAVWWRSDPFFGVLLIIALGLLAIAGLTEIIYRRTKSLSSETVVSPD